jgi:hypothetical protein
MQRSRSLCGIFYNHGRPIDNAHNEELSIKTVELKIGKKLLTGRPESIQ